MFPVGGEKSLKGLLKGVVVEFVQDTQNLL